MEETRPSTPVKEVNVWEHRVTWRTRDDVIKHLNKPGYRQRRRSSTQGASVSDSDQVSLTSDLTSYH